jgi:hypothetical protein
MRFTSRDGRWCVDLIRLRLTSDNRDGERFRVIHDGYFIAEVATLDELAQHVDLSELEIELSRTHDLQPWVRAAAEAGICAVATS